MNVIYLLVPLALILSGSFLAAYIWSARHGQYEDLTTPPHRIFLEDEQKGQERHGL